jgi:hypothetical protein
MTTGHVDDAQAAMTETDIAVDKYSDVVRTAMRDHISHALEDTSIQRAA